MIGSGAAIKLLVGLVIWCLISVALVQLFGYFDHVKASDIPAVIWFALLVVLWGPIFLMIGKVWRPILKRRAVKPQDTR